MKINQMKKTIFLKGSTSLSRQKFVKQELGKILLTLPFRMILAKFQEIFGMPNLIMWKNSLLVKLSL